MPKPSTFSIVAYDPQAKEWGVAVQSKFLAVGAVVSWAQAGVGAVATQAYANLSFGPDGLTLMGEGLSAPAALEKLLAADDGREHRHPGASVRVSRYSGWFPLQSAAQHSRGCKS